MYVAARTLVTLPHASYVDKLLNNAGQRCAPTGHRVTIPCLVLFRFADGKIVEDRPIFDRLDLLDQLGAIPAPEQATREVGA